MTYNWMKEKGKEMFIYRFYKSNVGLQKKKTGLCEYSDVEERSYK
jgi:hypothetical protein